MSTQKRWTLIAAVLGSSIVFLDSSVVTVALPAIGKEPSLLVDVLEGQNYIQYGYLLSLWRCSSSPAPCPTTTAGASSS